MDWQSQPARSWHYYQARCVAAKVDQFGVVHSSREIEYHIGGRAIPDRLQAAVRDEMPSSLIVPSLALLKS